MDDQLIEQFVTQFESMNSRLSKIEKTIDGDTSEVLRATRAAQRERRMLQDETRSSQAVASLSASEITSIRAGLQEMIEAAEAELQRKEASAKSGQQMAQIAYTGMQSELADAREQISKLQIERGTLEIKLNDVARDLGEYREKLKQAQSDVKASVFDQVNTAVAEQTSAAISTEVARQMRNYMRSQQEQAD